MFLVAAMKSNNAAIAERFDLAILHSDRDFSVMAEQEIIRVIPLN